MKNSISVASLYRRHTNKLFIDSVSIRIYFKVLCSILLMTIKSFGQTDFTKKYSSRVVPPSPEAASLGKYGNYPVSYYSGTTNVSVPLYTIQSQKLSLPITLNYHSGGIKVSEEASWVGLGWSLSAGGVITRTIRGSDDLRSSGYPFTQIPITADYTFTENAILNVLDPEPDIFFYNIAGKSGKFILKNKNNNTFPLEGIMLDKSGVKITCNLVSPGNYSWTLILEDGTKYVFSSQELTYDRYGVVDTGLNTGTLNIDNNINQNNISWDYNAFSSGGGNINSWYLTQIISPNLDIISLEYQSSTNYSTLTIPSVTQEGFVGTDITIQVGDYICEPPAVQKNFFRVSKSEIQNVYLKKIIFTNGSVEFFTKDREDQIKSGTFSGVTTPSNPQCLDYFIVKTSGGVNIKKVQFNYSYFNEGTYSSAYDKALNKRLKLNFVRELGISSTGAEISDMPAYNFEYYYDGETISSKKLPSKMSTAIDSWGFFNGKTSNDILTAQRYIPSLKISNNDLSSTTIIQGIDRSVNQESGVTALLKKIQFPTGGSTEFSYSSNQVWGTQTIVKTYKADFQNKVSQDFSISAVSSLRMIRNVQCGQYSVPCQSCGCTIQDTGEWYCKIYKNGNLFKTYTYGEVLQYGDSQCASNAVKCTLDKSEYMKLDPGTYRVEVNPQFGYKPIASFDVETQTDGNINVGGLRIEKLTNYDPVTDKSNIKKFFYLENPNKTSGVSLRRVAHIAPDTYINLCPSNSLFGYKGYTYSSLINTLLGSASIGSEIGYSRVLVSDYDGVDSLGATEYLYNNIPDIELIPFVPNSPSIPNMGNGMLTSETYLNKSNRVVKQITYVNERIGTDSYPVYDIKTGKIASYYANTSVIGPCCNNSIVRKYNLLSEFWYTKSTNTKIYDN